MSFSVGIVGLPNVGKSTLFKALTKKQVKIAPRPFTTIEPNVGKVSVPDKRLESLSSMINPEKTTPTTIEFVDVAGLVKGAHKGEGLGNQFLAQIRNCDAVLQVVRAFDKPEIENVLGEVDPLKETEVVNIELLMKDLETLEASVQKLESKKTKQDAEKAGILAKAKQEMEKGKLVSELDLEEKEKQALKDYNLLTSKPVFYILNTDNRTDFEEIKEKHLTMNLKEEEELMELSDDEKQELEIESKLDKLILSCYDILNLITFFTVAGGREVRAWTTPRNSPVLKAGGAVHSDFEDRFIRAGVVNWQELVSSQSWLKAKEKGLVRTVGREYTVRDGDVIEFKI